jgi:hypothetical protein
MFILGDRSPERLALPGHMASNDVPLIVQDGRFRTTAALLSRGTSARIGRLGDEILVNRASDPPPPRVPQPCGCGCAHASTARTYQPPDDRARYLIATEGGLVGEPPGWNRVSSRRRADRDRRALEAGEDVVLQLVGLEVLLDSKRHDHAATRWRFSAMTSRRSR